MTPLQIRYSKINGGDYDGYYHKEYPYHRKAQVEEEDDEIRDVLDRLVGPGDLVTDFGCGDGLIYRLLMEAQPMAFYVGIDPDQEYRTVNPDAPFFPSFVETTREYLDRATKWKTPIGIAVFAFSAEDSGWRNTLEAVLRADKALVIFYHKAWRTGINVFVNWLKFQLYYFPQARKLKGAFDELHIPVTKLCGRDGYYVAIKR